MIHHRKRALMAGAAFLTLCLGMGLGASPAFAQAAIGPKPPAPSADASAVDEVVVTARRREETLKDVPVAVSAFSAARLNTLGTRDITDLQRQTPSVTIQPARATNSTLIAFIRGVGQQDPLWGFDSGVGLYVDDVYIARPQAAVLDIFDVDRVEVLRGPQGTLYGRNTIGGAIKYVTRKIGDTPEFDLRGTFGSYGEHDEIASIRAPLGNGFGVSAAVAKYNRDGWGKNLNTGDDQYDKDIFAGRVAVEWQPNSQWFFRLSGDRTEDYSNQRNGHRELVALDPNTGAVIPGAAYAPTSNVYDSYSEPGSVPNHVMAEGVSFLAQYDLNEHITLKSISAYREGETNGQLDFDASPRPLLDVPAHYRDYAFTQEGQALFNYGRLHGVAGVFYMGSSASGAFDTVLQYLGGYTVFDAGYVDTKSVSVYADASFDVTPRLQVSLGGRYTNDDKTAAVLRQAYLGIRSPFFGNAGAVALGAPNTNYTAEKTFDKFTPRASVTYKFTSELTGYVSYGEGFKSGGFDMRGDAKLYPATINGYRPEEIATYEVGLKGSLLQRRLNFAGAFFSSDYKNQQITTQYPAGATVASVVDNAGSSTIRGLELEGSFRLLHDLSVEAHGSYIDAEFDTYTAFIPGSGYVNVAKQRNFAMTPKTTGGASATWTHDFGDWGRLTATPQVSYRSHYQQFETPNPLLDQRKSVTLVDFDALWSLKDGKYEIGLHGKNIGDRRYKIGGYYFPGAIYGNTVTSFWGAPESWTVSVAAKF